MRLSNNKAAVQWIVAVAFLLFVAAMSFARIRGGAATGYSAAVVWSVLMACWAASLILLVYAFRQACVLVEVMPDATLAVTWRTPLGRRTRIVQRLEIHSASVVESRDAEGGVYYHTRLALTDGVRIDLAEARRRKVCADICAHFNEAVQATARSRGAAEVKPV